MVLLAMCGQTETNRRISTVFTLSLPAGATPWHVHKAVQHSTAHPPFQHSTRAFADDFFLKDKHRGVCVSRGKLLVDYTGCPHSHYYLLVRASGCGSAGVSVSSSPTTTK
ncbi:hypothetical protein BaRGS_00021406 [Batillaria attramentaria]|uniref:Secreted protein n=1 Tax=Batillaria attramentaria TaxID=370345 RepID=A0ABD0KK20_9CAEN